MKARTALGGGTISSIEFFCLGGDSFDVDTLEFIVRALEKANRSFNPLIEWKDEIERKALAIAATGTCSYEESKDAIESVLIRCR